MKRLYISFLALTTLLVLGSSAYAQRGHGSSATTPGATPTSSHGDASSHSANSGSMDSGKKTPDQLLSQNTKLSDNLSKLLPTGVTAQQACDGFKNLGQCVAAAHVAKNLDISGGFDALKAKITGKGSVSLGTAIQDFKPDADAKAEVKKANKQSDEELRESNS